MQCLTNPQLTSWLRDRSIPQEPYENSPDQAFYLRFAAPLTRLDLNEFLSSYFDSIVAGTESVVQLVEWIQSEAPGDKIFSIRRQHGEDRSFSDASSHLFEAAESSLAVEITAIAAFGTLSTYVYSPRHRSTLYLWEGEIFDFWTDSQESHDILLALIQRTGLNQIEEAEQE